METLVTMSWVRQPGRTAQDTITLLRTVHNLKHVYFKNFPLNTFGQQLIMDAGTAESQTTDKGEDCKWNWTCGLLCLASLTFGCLSRLQYVLVICSSNSGVGNAWLEGCMRPVKSLPRH